MATVCMVVCTSDNMDVSMCLCVYQMWCTVGKYAGPIVEADDKTAVIVVGSNAIQDLSAVIDNVPVLGTMVLMLFTFG